jgi:predicted ATP-grasp superfamily ATP-dependent carboligase
MQKFTILVLDAAQRSALAVVRSLGKHSELRIYTAEAAETALAGESRYSDKFLDCPSSEHQPKLFIDWLRETQREYGFDLVIPVTEITSQLILCSKDNLGPLPTPFAEYEQVLQLAHKGNLVTLALSLGLKCPQSQHFNCRAEMDPNSIQYPIVIKPFQSRLFKDNIWINTTVGIIYNRDALNRYFDKHTYLDHSGFMLQEYILGHGAGIFCLYNKGQATAFFAHKRLREKPPQGGVSVLCESQHVSPELQEFAQKLLNAANWHGVAMVEFRIDQNGNAYLMEVNTRFWGSLQLSIDSGLDFPWLLVAQSLELQHQVPSTYKVGQKLRWLLGDLDSLYLYVKSTASLKLKLKRFLSFFLPDFTHTKHEINRISDFKPAIHEMKCYVKSLF